MIPFNKLTVATIVGGLMFGAAGAQASTVSYSMYQTPELTYPELGGLGYRLANAFGLGGGPWTSVNPGYGGGLPATWYVSLDATDSAAVSTANRNAAKLDGVNFVTAGLYVGANAYQDYITSPQAATNWGHTADFGLFHLNSAANVTITLSADGSPLSPGFSIWQGWDDGFGNRHGQWKANGAPNLLAGAPGVLVSSLGTFEGTAYNLTSGGSATLTVLLPAGNYSIIMGGISARDGSNNVIGGQGGAGVLYKVDFSTTPVPIPAAVWLFGSAAAWLGIFGRRKESPTS